MSDGHYVRGLGDGARRPRLCQERKRARGRSGNWKFAKRAAGGDPRFTNIIIVSKDGSVTLLHRTWTLAFTVVSALLTLLTPLAPRSS
jgi:hypothetical protein